MLRDYSSKWIHILDHNCFMQMGLALSKYFGKVTYSTFWEADFPISNDRLFGIGLENYWGKGIGIQRVDDFWAIRHKPDYYWAPDLYYAGICETLRDDLHKPVFASFYGEELELFREEAKEFYKSLNLPTIPFVVKYGFPDLRKYLQKLNGKKVFLKTDVRNRGDFETTGIEDYDLSKNFLDELEFKLGAQSNTYKFLVEDALEGDKKNPVVELGTDTFSIDGKYPENALLGIEIKGDCYCGHWGKWSKFPREATEFNVAISDTLKQYKYRNLISTEIRTRKENGKNVAYQNDLCCRGGHPPNELELLMITNLPDIVTFGAEGELVEPERDKDFGVQLNLHSSWAARGTQVVKFPDKLRTNVMLRRLCCIEDQLYVIPRGQGNTGIGCIVTQGDSFDDCIKQIKPIADQVKAECLEKPITSFDSAQEEIDNLKKMGINIMDI
jgi:hypothetical protein